MNAADSQTNGPLTGLKVLELASIGPGPHCAMLLADLGADVIRFDRLEGNGWPNPIVDRGRHSLAVDIRVEEGRKLCIATAAKADVLLEGFRPGVMERLGLGPDILCGQNPRLVYARMTGWGQSGPLANVVGHDINFIALTGVLAALADHSSTPRPPLNLVGDLGGGSLFLAFGIMAALWERQRSGQGQIIDAAIVDGVSSLMSMVAGLIPSGAVSIDPDRGLVSGAAPFYRAYRCLDGLDIAVGAMEPRFYSELLKLIDAPAEFETLQYETLNWSDRAEKLAAIFSTKTRKQWCEILEMTDACCTPVLTLEESMKNLHLRSRGTYVEVDGVIQAAPAPRFSRTPGVIREVGSGHDALRRWGIEQTGSFK